jgi:hypothetical protein
MNDGGGHAKRATDFFNGRISLEAFQNCFEFEFSRVPFFSVSSILSLATVYYIGSYALLLLLRLLAMNTYHETSAGAGESFQSFILKSF